MSSSKCTRRSAWWFLDSAKGSGTHTARVPSVQQRSPLKVQSSRARADHVRHRATYTRRILHGNCRIEFVESSIQPARRIGNAESSGDDDYMLCMFSMQMQARLRRRAERKTLGAPKRRGSLGREFARRDCEEEGDGSTGRTARRGQGRERWPTYEIRRAAHPPR